MKKSLFPIILLVLLASANIATAQIQLTFSTVQPSCHGYTNGSATVFATGGSGGYTYTWSTGQNTQTTFGIGAGVYAVTVQDEAPNTATGSVTVLEPSAVTAAITASDVNCEGTSGTLTAAGFGGTPPYSYAWGGPNSSATESVSVIAPGIYIVTVTDAVACSAVGSFTVATAITVEVIATDIPCAIYPNGGSANAVATGGVTPYIYSWSSGGTTAIITGIGAGPHICTVTSANGCIAIDSDYVDIPSALEVETIWLTPACGGNNNGSATVQASGGIPPYTYAWTPGGFSGPAQTGLAPNQYNVSAFDANLCQIDLSLTIPATDGLDVQLVVTSAPCVGLDIATATAVVNPPGSGYVYEWNIPQGSNNVSQLTGLAAGTVVSVTVTDPVSGCSGTASGVVGAHNNVEILVTDVDILCAGGLGSATAVASNGTPPYTYTWFNNSIQISNSSSISGLSPGAYLVSVVDSLGCIAQAVADIGIESAPHAVIDSTHVLVCGDLLSTVEFTNLSYDTYNNITSIVWNVVGPSVDTTITQQNQIVFQLPVDETITVQLIVTSGLGCSDTTSLDYNVPGYPDISLSLDSTTLNCVSAPVAIDVIGGDSSYILVWTPAVTLNPNPLHVLVSPTVTTTYLLTATDGNACTSFATITIPPLDSLFQLFVSDKLIETCSDSATLFASTSLPTTVIWSQGTTILNGNPITVPATPTTTIYTVTAITADSCILTDQVSVTGYGVEVSLDPNADPTICEEDSLTLSAIVTPMSGSLIYLWSVIPSAVISDPTASNPFLTGPAGTYTVKLVVTNVICADTLQFQVEILEGFDLEGSLSADLCDGLNVHFFNDSGIGGIWNFGDGSQTSVDINPVHTYGAPGPYHVVFTPNIQFQCTEPWDTTIQVQEFVLDASIADSFLQCAVQAEIQFFGIVNNPGSSIVSWLWAFSNGTPATSTLQNPVVTFTIEETITATLVVRDINGCLDTASLAVPVHFISDTILTELAICLGDSIQLNPGGFDPGATYLWSSVPLDSTLDVNDPTPVVTPIVPTVYSVQLSEGLCMELFVVSVTLKPGSDVRLPSDSLIVCSDTLVTIAATGNGSAGLEWSNSPLFTNIFATTQTVQVPPNGTYYVRTTGADCTAMDSILILLATPAIQAIPTDLDICLGEETALMLTNLNPDQNLHYFWDPALPDLPNPIVAPTETTTYIVTVTNQYGCTATLSFTVNVTTVDVEASADPYVVSFGDPSSILTATPGGNGTIISYSWTPAGTLESPNAPQTVATPTETTLYTVTVVTLDGCIATDTVTLTFRDSPCATPFVFVPKAFTPNNDQKNDYFIVRADGMTALKFIVWDRWGEIVYETYDPNDQGWNGTFQGKEHTSDSFAWYVWLTCGNGDIYEDKGNVTLLK